MHVVDAVSAIVEAIGGEVSSREVLYKLSEHTDLIPAECAHGLIVAHSMGFIKPTSFHITESGRAQLVRSQGFLSSTRHALVGRDGLVKLVEVPTAALVS